MPFASKSGRATTIHLKQAEGQGPPNYGPALMPNESCGACTSFQQGLCAKYNIPVDPNGHCDSFSPAVTNISLPPAPPMNPIVGNGSTLDTAGGLPMGTGIGGDLGKAAAVTYVPRSALDSVRQHGLLSGKALLDMPDALAAAAAGRNEDPEAFRGSIEKVLAGWKPDSANGPNIMFKAPPKSLALPANHPMKSMDLAAVRINLAKLLKDVPGTRVHGQELMPYDQYKAQYTPEQLAANQDDPSQRHRDLTPEELHTLSRTSARQLWSTYGEPDGVGRYAPNVPHAAVVTPDGRIPPQYLKFPREKTAMNDWYANGGFEHYCHECGKSFDTPKCPKCSKDFSKKAQAALGGRISSPSTPGVSLPSIANHLPSRPGNMAPPVPVPNGPQGGGTAAPAPKAQDKAPAPPLPPMTTPDDLKREWEAGAGSRHLLGANSALALPNPRQGGNVVDPGVKAAQMALQSMWKAAERRNAGVWEESSGSGLEGSVPPQTPHLNAPTPLATYPRTLKQAQVLAITPFASSFIQSCEDMGLPPVTALQRIKEAIALYPGKAQEFQKLGALLRDLDTADRDRLTRQARRTIVSPSVDTVDRDRAARILMQAGVDHPSVLPNPFAMREKVAGILGGLLGGGAKAAPKIVPKLEQGLAQAEGAAARAASGAGTAASSTLKLDSSLLRNSIQKQNPAVVAPPQSATSAAKPAVTSKPLNTAPAPAAAPAPRPTPAPTSAPAPAPAPAPISDLGHAAAGASTPAAAGRSWLGNAMRAPLKTTGQALEAVAPSQITNQVLGTGLGQRTLGKGLDFATNLVTGKGALQNALQGNKYKALGYGITGTALPFVGAGLRGEQMPNLSIGQAAAGGFGLQPVMAAAQGAGVLPFEARNDRGVGLGNFVSGNIQDAASVGRAAYDSALSPTRRLQVGQGLENAGQAAGQGVKEIGGFLNLAKTPQTELTDVGRELAGLQIGGDPASAPRIQELQKRQQDLNQSIHGGSRALAQQHAQQTVDTLGPKLQDPNLDPKERARMEQAVASAQAKLAPPAAVPGTDPSQMAQGQQLQPLDPQTRATHEQDLAQGRPQLEALQQKTKAEMSLTDDEKEYVQGYYHKAESVAFDNIHQRTGMTPEQYQQSLKNPDPANPVNQMGASETAKALAADQPEAPPQPEQAQSMWSSFEPWQKSLLLAGLGMGLFGLIGGLFGGEGMGSIAPLLGAGGALLAGMGATGGHPGRIMDGGFWQQLLSGKKLEDLSGGGEAGAPPARIGRITPTAKLSPAGSPAAPAPTAQTPAGGIPPQPHFTPPPQIKLNLNPAEKAFARPLIEDIARPEVATALAPFVGQNGMLNEKMMLGAGPEALAPAWKLLSEPSRKLLGNKAQLIQDPTQQAQAVATIKAMNAMRR